MGTAHDADQQALLLRAVLEGDEDAAPLLQGLVFRLVHLWNGRAVTQLSLPAPPAAVGPGSLECQLDAKTLWVFYELPYPPG